MSSASVSRASFQGYRRNEAQANNCFYEVIDVPIDGQVAQSVGKCLTRIDLEDCYRSIPPQPQGTIRAILDGRPGKTHANKSFKEKEGCESRDANLENPPLLNPLYFPSVYGAAFKHAELPALRALWNDKDPHWFGLTSFVSHRVWCIFSDRQYGGGREQEFKDLWLTVRENREGLVQVICFAPFATVCLMPPKDTFGAFMHDILAKPCGNVRWRMLRDVSKTLQSQDALFTLENGEQQRIIQLIILQILSVNLDQISQGLSHQQASKDLYEFKSRYGDSLADLQVQQKRHYQMVESILSIVSSAIQTISNQLRFDKTPIDYGSLMIRLQDFQTDVEYAQQRVKQLQEKMHDLRETTLSRLNVKQAARVNQLTLLAAFFLPLSLASALLSMQTRFVDLKLLLYDFIGVAAILATLAVVFALIMRYSKAFIDKVIPKSLFWWGRKRMIAMLLGITLLAFLASFLVGMLSDVILGSKVLGYSAAAVLFIWVACSWYRHHKRLVIYPE